MYIIAAGYILMGLFMVIFPQFTLEMVCYLLAAVLAVMGIFNIIVYFMKDIKDSFYKYDFAAGIIMILIAVIVIFRSQIFIDIIPLAMGVLIFANGVIKIQRVIDLKRTGYNGWIFVLLFALLCICVGIFVMLQPDFIAKSVVIVIGISMIFSGLTDVMTLLVLQKQVKLYFEEKGYDIEAEGREILKEDEPDEKSGKEEKPDKEEDSSGNKKDKDGDEPLDPADKDRETKENPEDGSDPSKDRRDMKDPDSGKDTESGKETDNKKNRRKNDRSGDDKPVLPFRWDDDDSSKNSLLDGMGSFLGKSKKPE